MHIAKKFPQLEEALGRDIAENSLLQNYLLLLRDNELDVRAATLASLT